MAHFYIYLSLSVLGLVIFQFTTSIFSIFVNLILPLMSNWGSLGKNWWHSPPFISISDSPDIGLLFIISLDEKMFQVFHLK